MVEDVYEIKTSFNTYAFQTRYFYDERQSRVRPTKKLVEVKFEIDRPVRDVRTLLADFPDAVELCSSECTIFSSDDVLLENQLIVQPTNPSQEHVKAAGLMAVGWTDEVPTETWVMGFKFKFNPLREKQIESGSYGLMTKAKRSEPPSKTGRHSAPRSRAGETLNQIGVWRSSEQK